MIKILLFSIFVLFSSILLRVKGTYEGETTTRECVLQTVAHPSCRNLKYETLDGSCNNPINPLSGKSLTPFKRLVPPSYGNGINTARLGSNQRPLPLSRSISNALNLNKTSSNTSLANAMFVQFGQYITHDMSGTSSINEKNGRPNMCTCSSSSQDCLIIPIPPHDPYYTNGTMCITRKGSVPASGCGSYPAEQMNRLSAYIDAETVYGWNEKMLKNLKDPSSDYGALRLVAPKSKSQTQSKSGCPMQRNQKLMPTLKDIKPHLAKHFDCPAHLKSPSCFAAGDFRVNENIGLSSTHLVFVREHNRIAKRLKTLNMHWSSDKVFQEARRIIIALHQLITYREFLPLLVGPTLMKQFDLSPLSNGFYFGYDATYDATISNAFATAAFRYGHSQVGNVFLRLRSDYKSSEEPSIPTFQGLFTQEAVTNGTTPSIMRGLMVEPAKTTDPQFVDDLRNLMFASSVKPGLDLLAINIQRGRAHGLAPYNDYRQFCGLQRAITWDDLTTTISAGAIEQLRYIYNDVDDIDLYVGGVAETPLHNANVGPTFGCIISYQFRDVRKGNRFWFENPGQFSEEQLNQLRKATFGSVLCNNMDGMTDIFPSAMQLENDANSRIPCDQLPQIDLGSWKEYNNEQDGEWTRWFPTLKDSAGKALQNILSSEAESVCKNPLNSELQLSNGRGSSRKVRFFCPVGTIATSAYPNVKKDLHYYWTPWLDRDTPGMNGNDDESLRYLKFERDDEVCDNPLYMQATTKMGKSAFDSNEVFLFLSPKQGLLCRGEDQTSGRCEDYRVRFYCPMDHKRKMYTKKSNDSKTSENTWTRWVNVGNPMRAPYDLETPQIARSRGYRVCRNPLQIDGRVAGTRIPARNSGDVLQRYNPSYGLKCDNVDQTRGRCRNYEVRYLCPKGSMNISR